MPKLALAMITKGDEGDKLDRCLNSVKDFVDGIFVTITTDDTNVSEVVNKYNGTYFNAPYKFHTTIKKDVTDWLKVYGLDEHYIKEGDSIFEFDKARNYSFDQVPKDYDYILWLDSDDILLNAKNLPLIVDVMERENVDAGFLNYLYQVEADDTGKIKNVLIQHLRERVVRRNKYKWVAPIHETLIPNQAVKNKDFKECQVAHLSDDKRMNDNFIRNIKTLELSVYQSQGKDPRPVYYLGKAHYDEGHLFGKKENYKYAKFLFKEYLQGKYPSGWAEERAQCWDFLAEIERDDENIGGSIYASLNSLQEYGQNPATYISLAMSYVANKEWDRAMHWLRLALSFKQPQTTLVINPKELEARSLEVTYHIALNTAKLDMALDAARGLYELNPNKDVFKDRLNFIMSLVEQRELTKNVVAIAKHLSRGQAQKLKPLLSAVPEEIAKNPFIVDLYKKVFPPRTHSENEISIYCGPGFTNWSPSLMENPKGSFMGGSEEAVVYLSRELQKLGWQVTVYGDPAQEENDNGVLYVPYYEFNPEDTFNILVSWRQPHLADLNIKTKGLYIWNHDVINQMDYTKERLEKITKLFVLSPAHKRNIPNIPDDKVVISANGVGGIRQKGQEKRNNKWVIWQSSYDRGLEHLLKIWDDVIKEVPDAHLHIFYGWDLFERFYKDNPERMSWKKEIDKLMNKPSITHHGRVSQKEIQDWVERCGVWAYPTHFYEISCISAMRSQMGGAIPVCTNYAALETTVQYGTKIDGDIYDPKVLERFKKSLIETLRNETINETIRKEMVSWATEWFTWEKVARQWSDVFKGKKVYGLIPKAEKE